MIPRWALLGARPPAEGADRAEVLRFLRELQVRSALLLAPFVVLIVLIGPSGCVVAALVAYGLLLLNTAVLALRARRAPDG